MVVMNRLPITFLFFYIILVFVVPCQGEYSIELHEKTGETTNSKGADAHESFWDTPLKIKVFIISATILALGWKMAALLLARIKKDPNNKNRLEIIEFIENNPGTTVNMIKKDLGLTRGTVRYHVNVLKEASKIILFQNGKNISMFKNESKLWNKKHTQIIEPHMKSKTCKNVCQLIYENPGITNSELSDKMGLVKAGITLHIKNLEKMNCIKIESNGRYKNYYMKDGYHPDEFTFFEKVD
jgi:predicted transcriptional regulator